MSAGSNVAARLVPEDLRLLGPGTDRIGLGFVADAAGRRDARLGAHGAAGTTAARGRV
jgi:hypothetical protein